jgi:hypothetical protein
LHIEADEIAGAVTTSQKYFVIAAVLWTVCGGPSAAALIVAVLGTTLIWQLHLGRSHTQFLVLSVLLGYGGVVCGLLLWSLVVMTAGLTGIHSIATNGRVLPYGGLTFFAALLAGELRWRSLNAPSAGHSIVSDIRDIRFNAFLFVLFSYGVWLTGGLVSYVLSPFIAPRLLGHQWASLAGPGTADYIHNKLFSWAMYGFYGVMSIPATLLMWKLRPKSRFFAYLLPLAFSILIPATGMLLGALSFVTMYLYGPWQYLLFTPLFTANIGGFIWAAVMGEVRWRIAKPVARPLALKAETG